MKKKTLEELETAKTAELELGRSIAAKAESEGRDLTAEERTSIKTHLEAARTAHNEAKTIHGDAEMMKELSILGAPLGELAAAGGPAPKGRSKSLGRRFTEAPDFEAWMKSIAPTGRIPDSAKGLHSPAVGFQMKDVLSGGVTSGDGAAGALVDTQWLGLMDGLAQFQRPLSVASLVSSGSTTSDAVEYARVVGFTNNAATVAEARGDSDGVTGGGVVRGNKPESAMELEKVTANVKTLAHWLPATKRALSDAAQIRSLIDEFLNYGLLEELEDQIVNGDGTGENFDGILNTDGIQEQVFDTDLITTTRKAKTLVRVNGRTAPTAYLVNPEDNERIDLLRDGSGGSENTGAFLFGNPAGTSTPTLWGLPRIETEAVPAGTALLGNFRQAMLWDRESASIQVSDAHEDFFVRNLVAILAEMRAAFGVIRPLAFCAVALEEGS